MLKKAFSFSILSLITVGCTRNILSHQEKNQFEPVATIKDLMDSIVDPSADVVWNAVGTVADEKGIRDFEPKSDKEWGDVRNGAIRVIEGANLLMMEGRHAASNDTRSPAPEVELDPKEIDALMVKDRKVFDAFAQALNSTGRDLLKAIEERNRNSILDAGSRLDAVCESCHRTFWYPQRHARLHLSPFATFKTVLNEGNPPAAESDAEPK